MTRPADRRAGRGAVGQGLGRRPRLDEARRLRHALSGQARRPEAALSRPRARRRDGRLSAHCTFDLNPRAASIDTPLHGFVPHRACRPCPSRCGHRDRRRVERRGADARGLRRRARLSALATAGLRPGPQARRDWPRTIPNRWAWCSAAMACSPGATTSKSCYETTLRIINKADRLARANDTREPAFGGALSGLARARSAARGRAPADAGDPRPDLAATNARSATSTTRRRCSSSSIRKRLKQLAPLGTSCPDHFLRTKIRPLVCRSIRPTRCSTRARQLDRTSLSRRLRGLLRTLQAARLAGDARSQPGHLSRPRRRHAVLRQGQGDGAHRRANSTSTPSMSCAAPPASTPMSACPSRKPSTSNTGCSRRPSSSACRSRRASPAGSRLSPAAPAASAGDRASGYLRRGRLRRARRHRRATRSTRAVADFAQSLRQGQRRAASRWT